MSAAKVANKKKSKLEKKAAKLEAKGYLEPSGSRGSDKTAPVRGLMTTECQSCGPHDNLATAASRMWNGDCGSLPVLDEARRPCGWITDRDIGMAVAMQSARAADIRVADVMSSPVHSCRENDSVSDAMAIMAGKQVRRLAVLDEEGALAGVLSIADLVRSARARASASAPSVAGVFEALRAIGAPHGGKAGARAAATTTVKAPKAAKVTSKAETPSR